MAETPLIKKLRIQPGQRLLIVNAPADYMDQPGDLPQGVEVAEKPAGTFDFVQLLVKTLADLRSNSKAAFEAVKYDGLLWISYPKKTSKLDSDLSRDVIWAEVAESGWRPVAQVSVNEVWSAMRLRPAEKVGKYTRRNCQGMVHQTSVRSQSSMPCSRRTPTALLGPVNNHQVARA